MCKANISPLTKKAKRKYINLPKVQNLLDMQKAQIIPLNNRKQYMRTLFCTAAIKVNHDGKTQSEYCKNRACAVCNAIRSAVRLNKFKDHLPKNAQFTTLTIPNCNPDQYPEVWAKMKHNFMLIRKYLAKKGYPFQFVANLEATINEQEKSGNYMHPHFHVLHSWLPLRIIGHAKKPYQSKKETEKIGKYKVGTQQKILFQNILIDEWLKMYPEAKNYLQHTVPVTDEFNIMEVFKYSLKPFQFKSKSKNQTLTDYENKLVTDHQKYLIIYDKLYSMQKGKRTFFSNIKTVTEKQENDEIAKESDQTDKAFGTYEWKKSDWINEHGECLSGYIPEYYQQRTNEILSKNIQIIEAKPYKPIKIDRQITAFTILHERKFQRAITLNKKQHDTC